MTKAVLRDQYRRQRAGLPEKERLRLNDLLLIQFQKLPLPHHLQVVLSYWPLEAHGEVNTFLMTDYLQFRLPGLQLAYPVADFSTITMKPVLVNDTTRFELNRYGIAEPVNGIEIDISDIDMVLVPLLVFDRQGYRIGYGKGFYDRFLPACRKDCIKTGLAYFDPLPAIDGIDQFDVPLTTGITPGDIYEF